MTQEVSSRTLSSRTCAPAIRSTACGPASTTSWISTLVEARRESRLAEVLVLGAIFLDLFGFGMLLPDIQYRAERLGMAGWAIGAALAVTFVIQLFVSPLWGRASDRVGRKPVLLACAWLSAAGLLTYGFATKPIIIVASRMLSGFGGANVSIAQAYMADLSSASARTAAMGRIGAAVSAGLIAGSASLALPFMRGLNVGLVAGALSATGACGLVFLPGRARVDGEGVGASTLADGAANDNGGTHLAHRARFRVFDLNLLKSLPALRSLVVVAVVAWFSLAMLEGTFGRLIERTLGFHRQEFGEVFALEALVGVVAQGVLLAWLVRRTDGGIRLRVSYLAQGAGLALMPFVPGLGSLFLVSAVYAAGSGVANGTVNGLCSVATPASRQGELFGLLQSARSVGFAIGPLLGGMLFDVIPRAPYLLAGGTCVAAAILVRIPRAAS
ncbi:MAG: MFS transporter [Fimbriimonadaceae bacterium]